MRNLLRWKDALVLAHVLLWGLYLLPPVPYYLERMSVTKVVLVVASNGLFFGLFVYANLLYFIPQFFLTGQRLKYLFITLLIAIPYGWIGGHIFSLFTLEQPPLIYYITRFYSLTFAFGFIDQYVHQQKTRNRLLQLESQQTRMELDRLKAQVNPHFLFNTLHNLYALTLNQSPQAPDVVLRLSSLMRYLFTTSHLETVPLTQEASYLEHYIELERLRLNSQQAVINFTVQGPLDTVDLPPMLLIPFVENAFKHGVETDTGQVFVAVTLAVQDRDVFFEVDNSKPRHQILEPVVSPPRDGTGLQNIKQRLDLLYGDCHQLIIDEQPYTYKITLALHL